MVESVTADFFDGKVYELEAVAPGKRQRKIAVKATVGLISEAVSLEQSIRGKLSTVISDLESSLVKFKDGSAMRKLSTGPLYFEFMSHIMLTFLRTDRGPGRTARTL